MSAIKPENATVEELVAGYRPTPTAFACLHCPESTRVGRIYPQPDGGLLDAERAMQEHIRQAHTSPFQALLDLGKNGTGLTDTQRALLGHLFAGLSDKEIQPLAGGVSLSTLRNQRFALREKARQARVLVALNRILETRQMNPTERFIPIPGTKRADDERFAITEAEFHKVVAHHFPDGPDGRMDRFPKKEKRKVIVMIHVLKRFDPQGRYTQKEVNAILDSATDDHTTLCRFMVDYGFLGRTRDGSEYWVEGGQTTGAK